MSRTVVITGAAGALGSALARRFGREEGTNLVLSDLHSDALEETAASLAELPCAVATLAGDVGDVELVNALVDLAVERFGRLDVMINNAGMLHQPARIHNLSVEDWEVTLRVNLLGVVHGIAAAVRAMRQTGGGAIVSTASVAGMTAWTYGAAYGASKAAVIQVTKVAAAEYAKENIRVNCVCPGSFNSTIFGEMARSSVDALVAKHPMGGGTPEDLVEAFVYLAGEGARWTTGTALVVDGGYTAV